MFEKAESWLLKNIAKNAIYHPTLARRDFEKWERNAHHNAASKNDTKHLERLDKIVSHTEVIKDENGSPRTVGTYLEGTDTNKIVLEVHGNLGTSTAYASKHLSKEPSENDGFSHFFVEYQDYLPSSVKTQEGKKKIKHEKPGQQNMVKDIKAALLHLDKKFKGSKSKPVIVIHAECIGCAPAAEAAKIAKNLTNIKVVGQILNSPTTSMEDAALDRVSALEVSKASTQKAFKDNNHNLAQIVSQTDIPTLILEAGRDKIFRPERAEEVFSDIPNNIDAAIVKFDGEHISPGTGLLNSLVSTMAKEDLASLRTLPPHIVGENVVSIGTSGPSTQAQTKAFEEHIAKLEAIEKEQAVHIEQKGLVNMRRKFSYSDFTANTDSLPDEYQAIIEGKKNLLLSRDERHEIASIETRIVGGYSLLNAKKEQPRKPSLSGVSFAFPVQREAPKATEVSDIQARSADMSAVIQVSSV